MAQQVKQYPAPNKDPSVVVSAGRLRATKAETRGLGASFASKSIQLVNSRFSERPFFK